MMNKGVRTYFIDISSLSYYLENNDNDGAG
jgi:hypothetical protein